jgi:hypothetical protein
MFLFFAARVYGKKWPDGLRMPLFIACILLLSFMLAMAPVSNPVGHRYFLVLYLLMCIVGAKIMGDIRDKAVRFLLLATAGVVLVSGHCWMYPLRFGNGWDGSLKSLPYFGARKKMNEYLAASGIRPTDVASTFPLYSDTRFTDLTSRPFVFSDKDSLPFASHRYVLESNVSNAFTDRERKQLRKEWPLVHETGSGVVYFRLYRNPEMRFLP